MPDTLLLRQYTTLVFLGVFAVSLALQMCVWLFSIGYLDETLWSDAARMIARGVFPGFDSPTPVHPGTGLLLPAAAFLQLPLEPRIAFHIALSLMMAGAITLSSYVAYILRPERLWWLAIAVLLAPNVIFPAATSPSALASAIAVLFVLLVLHLKERGVDSTVLACLGASAGIMAAVRIDIGGFFFVAALPYLWHIAGKRLFISFGFAAAFFAALDPYIYLDLVSHLQWFFWQVNQNRQVTNVFDYTYWSLFFPAFAALAAFVYVFLRPHLTSVPRSYLLWLLAISEILGGLLMFSNYHPMRYFLPLICIWEVFFALFALEYVSQEPSFKKLRVKPEYVVIFFFALSRIWRVVIMFSAIYLELNWPDAVLEASSSVMRALFL